MMSMFSSFDFFMSVFPFFILISLILFAFNQFFTSKYMVFSNMVYMFFVSFFDSTKAKNFGKEFSLFFLSLVICIMTINLDSVPCYVFPLTSQTSFVALLALSVWLSIFFLGLLSNPAGSTAHFIPEGAPMYLAPFLFAIELISSVIRPLTLTVRLVANILAGHLLMSLLCDLIYVNFIFMPALFVLASVELAVALIQAYIFSTMLVLYYSEV